MDQYLNACNIIDWQNPAILQQAAALASGQKTAANIAEACFVFVRDEIKHSLDYQLTTVTLTASDVLRHGSGYCYAKSHLLAALLRANGLPAALCYQRLALDSAQNQFCLHGLNSVYLPNHGWYRIDARGNKTGVDAQFTPPFEQLAFATSLDDGEKNIETRHAGQLFSKPLACIVDALSRFNTVAEVAKNLPDSDVI